jgi:hypothetical protein
LLAVTVSLVTFSLLSSGVPGVRGQGAAALAIDPSPTGNAKTSVATVNGCRAVNPGDTFGVDLIIQDVESLLAFEVYVDFDEAVLELIDRDVEMFLDGNEGSNVIDSSNPIPAPVPYRVSGVDISDPPTPDSGSGTLAQLIFRAKAAGTTALEYARIDLDDDGDLDVGPYLKNFDAEAIGDEDDDTFFDGDTLSTRIEVGGDCPEELLGPVDEGGSGTDWIPFAAAAGAIGGMIVVAAGIVLIVRKDSHSA